MMDRCSRGERGLRRALHPGRQFLVRSQDVQTVTRACMRAFLSDKEGVGLVSFKQYQNLRSCSICISGVIRWCTKQFFLFLCALVHQWRRYVCVHAQKRHILSTRVEVCDALPGAGKYLSLDAHEPIVQHFFISTGE